MAAWEGPWLKQGQESAETVSQARRPRFFYGWYIVGAGAVQGFVNLAVFQIGQGAFIKDVRDQMGWSLTAISLGFSLKQFESGLLAPVSGYLIDRLGPRLMASIGVVLMSVGLILFARMDSLWMFYLSSTVIAIGQAMASLTAYSTAVMHWFRRKRGLAYSILAMGRAWGYVGVLLVTLLMVRFGWREAATISALAFCGISLPLALVIRRRPEPYGYLPDGDRVTAAPQDVEARGAPEASSDSFTVQQALRSVAFWLLLLSSALYGFVNNANLVHQIPHLRNVGFSASAAGVVVAIFGGAQVVGRLASGWIGDKVGRYRLLMVSFLFLALGWVSFANVSAGSLWTLGLYIVLYGIGQSAHTATDQAVVADFFGTRRYATIRGLVSTMSLVGSLLGPIYAGRMFDTFGNYHLAFLTLGPIVALGTPAVLLAGKPTLAGAPAKGGEAPRTRQG
ncbi:MAG: MFS transporter [Chloroflexi bacterium]|nr:MFS transporter [Chloroflexota bacterium]